MTKEEAIQQAIDRVKGQDIPVGTIVACRQHELTHELKSYDELEAVCEEGGNIRRFLRSEIFDVKKVRNVANHLLNVGFWKEGMESIIVNLEK